MKTYLSSVIGKKVMPQDNRIGGGMKIYLAGITSSLWLLRGAKKKGKMSCCFLTGAFKDNADTKAEFLAACRETA